MKSKLSRSPRRNTFQKENYIQRQEKDGKKINQDYLDLFDTIDRERAQREQDPAWRENNLEYDLRSTDWILDKVRANKSYAQNLYAALCNNEFQKNEVWPTLKDQRWSCTWRSAGGIVADMCGEGDYIEWYCSGMVRGHPDDNTDPDWTAGYKAEGTVTDEVQQDLKRLGWRVIPGDE